MIDLLEIKKGQKLDTEIEQLLKDIQVQLVGKHGFHNNDAKDLVRNTIMALKDKGLHDSVIFCIIDSVWNACAMELE